MVGEERERGGGEKETYGFAAQYSLMGGLPIVTAQIHMGMGGIVWE